MCFSIICNLAAYSIQLHTAQALLKRVEGSPTTSREDVGRLYITALPYLWIKFKDETIQNLVHAEVDALVIVHELEYQDIIPHHVQMLVTSAVERKSKMRSYLNQRRACNKAALKVACNIITAVVGNPKIKALSKSLSQMGVVLHQYYLGDEKPPPTPVVTSVVPYVMSTVLAVLVAPDTCMDGLYTVVVKL